MGSTGQHAVEQPRRGTRPRNRRSLILTAAADLFVREGYPNVSMKQIAEAVAISPSALYRHFRGKEELLHSTVSHGFGSVRSTLEAATGTNETLVPALAAQVLEHRGLGILWQRESRHLSPALREELREELVLVERMLADLIKDERPALPADRVDLLSWATMAALMSVSYQRVELPRDEYVALLIQVGHDTMHTALPDDPSGPPALEADASEKTTAELLLAAATRLFAERGYQTIGIDDVAAEVGIAGPSVYHHFDGKQALLAAAMADGARALIAARDRVLAGQDAPTETLSGLVHAYSGYSLAHPHVLDLLITETASLDAAAMDSGFQSQRDYARTWERLLMQVHPNLPRGHARVRVQAALSTINDVARTPYLRDLAGIDALLPAVGESVLGLADQASGKSFGR